MLYSMYLADLVWPRPKHVLQFQLEKPTEKTPDCHCLDAHPTQQVANVCYNINIYYILYNI